MMKQRWGLDRNVLLPTPGDPWGVELCYTMPFYIPWHTSPGHTTHHAMSARPLHIPCDARQAIAYTIPCPPGHTKYHVTPARPYHILCQAPCTACQAMTIYHSMPTRPCHIPCDARQAILHHAMPARPYQTLPGPPGYIIIPCDAHQEIVHTMWGPQGHTIHHAMPTRPAIYHAHQAIPYSIPCP